MIYNYIARIYNKLYKEEQVKKYKKILNRVKPKGKVLDIGCGTGLLFDYIERSSDYIIGLDISLNMLRMVKGNYRVDLVCGDMHLLPFRREAFDMIFSITVLSEKARARKVIKEINFTRKCGSTVVLSILRNERNFISKIHKYFKGSILLDYKEIKDIIIIHRC